MDIEHKKVEFDNAKYGTIGLESSFGTLNNTLGLDKTISMLTGGKDIFNLENQTIAVGNKADLSLFTPNDEIIFAKDDILSTSHNSAFLGKKGKGTTYGIVSNGKLVLK